MVYRSLERKMYCKYVTNRQRKGPAVLDAIKNISVVWLSTNFTYPCVGRQQRHNVCPYYWRSMWFNKITTVNSRGLSVIRTKNVLKYVTNQQREGPEVINAINKISVVCLEMNVTYLCVGRWQRRNVHPYCWRSVWCNQVTTVNSRGLLVVRTKNVL